MQVKNDNEIWKQVDETLQQMDTLKKVDADAFFYTRLQARIENIEEKQVWTDRFWSIAVLKPVLVGAVIVLNFAVLASVMINRNNNTLSRDEQIDQFMSENALNVEEDTYLVYNYSNSDYERLP